MSRTRDTSNPSESPNERYRTCPCCSGHGNAFCSIAGPGEFHAYLVCGACDGYGRIDTGGPEAR